MKTLFSAFIAAAALSVVIGICLIPILKKLKFGQNILGYVEEHNYKSGTPTMGGIIFIAAGIISFYLFSSGGRFLSTVCVLVGLAYMVVGLTDDAVKIFLKRNEGLSPVQKTVFEFAIATIISIFAYTRGLYTVFVPFSEKTLELKGWFIPLCVVVFIATTNSVNLTDGLDGLAGGVSYLNLLFSAAIIIIQTSLFADKYATESEYYNVALLEVSLAGGIVGYLLFNTYKASVFMGDTGSLALGGFIAICQLLSGNMLFIPILGIMFVVSSLSVIIQVLHYKRTKRRVFLMAPIHHHFQHKGYAESKIVFAYKLITAFAGLICIIYYLFKGGY